MTYSCQQCGIVNLVAVEIQDGQYGAISNRIEKLVDVPRSSQRTSLGFAITDNSRDNQVGVVEDSTACVRQYVSQFPAVMNRTRGFGSAVAADTTGKRKLL